MSQGRTARRRRVGSGAGEHSPAVSSGEKRIFRRARPAAGFPILASNHGRAPASSARGVASRSARRPGRGVAAPRRSGPSRGRRVGATVGRGTRVPASSARPARASRRRGGGRRARAGAARVVPRRRRRRARARFAARNRGANPSHARRPRLGARRDARRARRLTPKPAVDRRGRAGGAEWRAPEARGSSAHFRPAQISRGRKTQAGEIARAIARAGSAGPGRDHASARRAARGERAH